MSPSLLVCADRHASFRDSDLFAVGRNQGSCRVNRYAASRSVFAGA